MKIKYFGNICHSIKDWLKFAFWISNNGNFLLKNILKLKVSENLNRFYFS